MTDRIEAMTNHSEGGTPRTDEQCCAATVEEMCEGTLKHYDDISTKACHWNNQVPQAIKFWYLEKPKLERDLSASQSALAEKEREVEELRQHEPDLIFHDAMHELGARDGESFHDLAYRKAEELEAAEARAGEAEKNYSELIMAVSNKWPNESRHETALRYIKRMEMGDSAVTTASKAAPPASPTGKEKP